MSNILARHAESAFWMARYMERAENLARLLDVNETFARDSSGAPDWLPIVQLQADEDVFFKSHAKATAAAVLGFYVLDRDNPNSIVSSVYSARENARALRHLISTEMWTHLNVFYNRLAALTPNDVAVSKLSSLCTTIKLDCQLHTGITEGTFHRDQYWYFYQIGKYLERADQTTRLLDIKYHTLLPSPNDVGTPVDVSQWNTLLRSAAAYHAFRRIHPYGMQPSAVAAFLLFNPDFPRSVQVCLGQVHELVIGLGPVLGVRIAASLMTAVENLHSVAASGHIDRVLFRGLHEHLDDVQLLIIDLAAALGRAFFGHRDAPS